MKFRNYGKKESSKSKIFREIPGLLAFITLIGRIVLFPIHFQFFTTSFILGAQEVRRSHRLSTIIIIKSTPYDIIASRKTGKV